MYKKISGTAPSLLASPSSSGHNQPLSYFGTKPIITAVAHVLPHCGWLPLHGLSHPAVPRAARRHAGASRRTTATPQRRMAGLSRCPPLPRRSVLRRCTPAPPAVSRAGPRAPRCAEAARKLRRRWAMEEKTTTRMPCPFPVTSAVKYVATTSLADPSPTRVVRIANRANREAAIRAESRGAQGNPESAQALFNDTSSAVET